MKRIFLTILFILLIQVPAICQETTPQKNVQPPVFYTAAQQEREVEVFCDNNLFGLKDKSGNIVAPAIYQKIIMTGRAGWIIQRKNKYGLMDSKGNILIPTKYRYADRILGRYIKLGSEKDFGIYNEYGEEILPPIYSAIDLLYGKMFLTYKNYRYGISDFKGNTIIPNICDDIYMPTVDSMIIKYQGVSYELNNINEKNLSMPTTDICDDSESSFLDFIAETGTISGYSVLTLSDYMIKIISSISPAHEETIDDLILSHGVDTVGILKKFTWIPKYPITFVKKYYANIRNPYNGPLSDTRNRLKNKR
jgi:hypothetical protein